MTISDRFPTTVTAGQMAQLLDLSIRSVHNLAAAGVLARGAKRGEFELLPSMHGYTAKLEEAVRRREDGDGQGHAALQSERRHRLAIRTEIEQRELDALRAETLTQAEVAGAWERLARRMIGFARALPGRSKAALPALTAHDTAVLTVLADDMLSEIGDEVDAGVVGADPEVFRELVSR